MIKNKLDPDIIEKLNTTIHKNYLLENIKKNRISPEKTKNESNKINNTTFNKTQIMNKEQSIVLKKNLK